jgi:hypothetical protein
MEPIHVTLTGAELVWMTTTSWDGTTTYVVPAYRFTGTDGDGNPHEVVALALDDSFLRPPDDAPADSGRPPDAPVANDLAPPPKP